MDLNQYEQSLIKCEYIRTVCDQLLKQLETKALAKIFSRNKLLNNQQGTKEGTRYDRIEAEYKEQYLKDNREYQTKIKTIEQQVKEHEQQMKKLKNQISLLKQSRYQGAKHTRINIRKIKQASQIEIQSVQLRKLLNYQLQNLNTLQSSNIQVNQAIEQYEKKQIQLKAKIKKVMEKENDYFRCREMEEKYEALVLNKRKLVEQNKLFDQNKHSEIMKKIMTIAQANQNLIEMNRYEKELGLMIKEKQFIIDEIQSRQEIKNQKDHNKVAIQDDDDTQIFQNEINNLRKTIANRKFLQRTKNLQKSNKLEAFLNNSTPKNSIHYANDEGKNDPKRKSIFKIEIQPISHYQSINQNDQKELNFERCHRNSLPNHIGKKQVTKSHPKNLSNLPKEFFSQNKLRDLDTIEVAALQNIIRKKQSQLKQVSDRSPILELQGNLPNEKKANQANIFARSSHPNKKLALTQPVELKEKSSSNSPAKKINDSSVTPNSRFIEQIIESNSGEYLQRLKNNVRFRTKKSETEKYKHLEMRQNLKRMQKRMEESEIRSPNFASSKTVISSISNSKDTTPKHMPTKKKSHKNNLSFDTAYDNEFMGNDLRLETASQQKQYKLKYKDKIQSISEIKSSVDSVLQKINLLKKTKQESGFNEKKQEQNGKEGSKKEPAKDKVKIFKLSNRRKYGNALSFQRKGKAQGMEHFESEDEEGDKQLPKIQEEEESIRNTIQSIAQV